MRRALALGLHHLEGVRGRLGIAVVALALGASTPAIAAPLGQPGMVGVGGALGAPRVAPGQMPGAGYESPSASRGTSAAAPPQRVRRQRPPSRPQGRPPTASPSAGLGRGPRMAPPVVASRGPSRVSPSRVSPSRQELSLEDFQDAMEQGGGPEFDEREQMMMGPAGVPGMHEMPGELMGAPRANDPRALVVRSPAGGGIRPEVGERLDMVAMMAEQGMLEQAADFIPHPGSVRLTGAERSRFDRLANDIAKAAAKAAKSQSKMGNLGNGRPQGWRQATPGLPNYDHGTALDGIRAIENLRDKGMSGGAISSWWTNRSLRKADKSIASWGKQRRFWNRRNGMATASAVGAMIERGAAPNKIARAIKSTYGELLSVAWRDARTGDIETSLNALSNLEMLAQAPDVPEDVRAELQRRLAKDEGKIRKTRLRAYEVGIPYLVNMVSRQKNMNQHASAEQLLGRVMYLAKKFDAVKAAGGADAPVVDDGRPLSGDDIRRHIHRRDLYTRRLLTKMLKRYGEGGIEAGTQAIQRETLTPMLTAELQQIEAQMGGLEQEADQMHAQLLASGKSPQEVDQLLEQRFLPVFEQMGARHQQLTAQLNALHAPPEQQELGPHVHSRVHAGNVSPAMSIMPGAF